MTKQEFLKEVHDEVVHLKANATRQELSKLDLDTFQPANNQLCIYGQMTGDCYCPRAIQLYPKKYYDLGNDKETFRDFKHRTNFSKEKEFHTALELYITIGKPNVKGIMNYLKGKTDKFSL